jgi:DNA uptake protein ComE-like DNA-binding protein
MKIFITLLSILVLSLSLSAADTAPPKKNPAKPSAKMEAVAKTLTVSQRMQLLSILNVGDEAALMAIPGIGEVRAKAIQKVRPLADVTQVLSAEGVGEATFAGMIAYAKAGFPPPVEKKAKSAPKKKDSKDAK